ncbi:MAG: hypothetical protein ACFB16_00485 [Phormidesmis sp.]
MASPSLTKLRTYLHLVPVFGTVLSLWTLYEESNGEESNGGESDGAEPDGAEPSGKRATKLEDTSKDTYQRLAASRLSVILGLGCVSAIALLGGAASTQASQVASLRLLLASSFIGSGYFVLSLGLMYRVATDRSIRLPGVSQLGRRLP